MPTGKIPFGAKVFANLDAEFVADGNSLSLNMYTRDGVSIKRPGLVLEVVIVGQVMEHLFWWAPKKAVVAVSASGRVYVVTLDSSGFYAVVDTTSVSVSTSPVKQVYFTYDNTNFYLSDGGKIMYSNGTATSLAYIADADAPTTCTHVGYVDGYIVATAGAQKWQFSAIGDGLTWNALDFANAAGSPDLLSGLAVFDRKVFLIGTDTTEIWYNDGASPFSRLDGGFYNVGCISPNSIHTCKIGVLWLDNQKNLVLSTGGAPEVLNSDYKRQFDTISHPSSCRIEYMEWEGLPLVLLRFPIDRRTFVYNIKEQSWDEWATWNGSRWLDWSGRSYVWAPDFGRHLFSASEGGGIYRFSKDAHRDNTSSIVVSKRTGFINHGNDALKRNDKLLLRIKRGYGDITASNPPKLMIKWRDDASPVWSNTIEVSLGKSGDFNQFIELYPRGVYRSRQWEISCSEPIPLAFFDAEEEYSVLRG